MGKVMPTCRAEVKYVDKSEGNNKKKDKKKKNKK